VLYKPEVKNYVRGQEILDKYPCAEFVEVPSHWKIPELHGFHGSVLDSIRIKNKSDPGYKKIVDLPP
jgi:hypothetical protein